jgi:hypothetical protein
MGGPERRSNPSRGIAREQPPRKGAVLLRNTPDGRSEEGSEGRGPPLGVPVEWNYRPGYVLTLSAGARGFNRTKMSSCVVTSACCGATGGRVDAMYRLLPC